MRRVLPWLILLTGLIFYVQHVAGPVKDKVYAAEHARDYASYHYAVQAAAQDQDPYDKRVLGRLARAEGTRASVHPFFYPPPFLLTAAWTLPLSLQEAYRAWFWLDSVWLALSLLAIAPWLPRGAMLVGTGALLAGFTPIFDNHWMGQANLPVLAAVLWGLRLERGVDGSAARSVAGGALVGLACMMKMSPGLLVAWWIYRRRWAAAISACATAVALSIAALPLVDLETQTRFYLEILPGFATGDYNGLTVPIDLPGNHSIPNLWAQALPGDGALSEAARRGASLSNLAVLAGLAIWLRRQVLSPRAVAAAGAAVSVLMLIWPVYTYEHHTSMMIFPMLIALGACWDGRLGRGWWPILIAAWVAQSWQWGDVRAASRSAGGAAGWLIQEAKFFAELAFGAMCALAATREGRPGSGDRA